MPRIHSLLVVVGLAACGGAGASSEAPQTKTYKQMNKKERAKYMKEVVLPKTKEIFAAFDPEFQKMDCKTCHGDGVTDGTFKMPNPKIRPLPNSEELFMAWMQKEPDMGRWGKFMGEQVEPLMAELLGMSVFDPKTKTGEMSCMACHTLISSVPAPVEDHDHAHDH